jgi:short-subunit dehydrogenase
MRTAYAATKHAQVGFFDSLRIELRDTGVSVTVIAPYFVRSEIRKRSPGPDGRTVEGSPVKESEIMSAEECARLMVRAMEKRRRMLVMSFKGKLGRWTKLVAPGLVDRMVAATVRKGK